MKLSEQNHWVATFVLQPMNKCKNKVIKLRFLAAEIAGENIKLPMPVVRLDQHGNLQIICDTCDEDLTCSELAGIHRCKIPIKICTQQHGKCVMCMQLISPAPPHICDSLYLSTYAWDARGDLRFELGVVASQAAIRHTNTLRADLASAKKEKVCKAVLSGLQQSLEHAAALATQLKTSAKNERNVYVAPDGLDKEEVTATRHLRAFPGLHHQLLHVESDSGQPIINNQRVTLVKMDSSIQLNGKPLEGLYPLLHLSGMQAFCLYGGVNAGLPVHHNDELTRGRIWGERIGLAIMKVGPVSSRQYVDPSLKGGVAVIMNQKCLTNVEPVHELVGGKHFAYMRIKEGCEASGLIDELVWDYEASCTKESEVIKCLCRGVGPNSCGKYVCALAKPNKK